MSNGKRRVHPQIAQMAADEAEDGMNRMDRMGGSQRTDVRGQQSAVSVRQSALGRTVHSTLDP